MSDIGDTFDEIFAESSEGGDQTSDELNVPQNATIHMGLDDDDDSGNVSTETEEDEVDDTDTGPDATGSQDTDFDVTSHKDKLVSVKVNGETIKVPLSQALDGFMRQEDYTRKTQQIAADRQAIQWANDMRQALTTDPVGTLRALQEHLGVQDGDAGDPYGDLDPEIAPVVRAQDERLQRQEQWIQEQQQREILAEVKAEIADVKSRYADFDAQTILPLAAQRGLSIEDAYLLNKAKDLINGQTAAAQAAAATEAARVAAEAAAQRKRDNAKKVTNGSSNVRTVPSDEDDYTDIEDLFNRNLEKYRQ